MYETVDTTTILSGQYSHMFRPLLIGHHNSKQDGRIKKVETCRFSKHLRT